MIQVFSEFFPGMRGQEGKRSNWSAIAGSAVIALLLCLLAYQTWSDKQTADKRAYDHLVDSARLAERGIYSMFATNRSLAVAVSSHILTSKGGLACPIMCDDDLRVVQKTYAELLPGLDLLVMDSDGRTVAETEVGMGNRFPGLFELVEKFRTDRGALAAVRVVRNMRNEPALLVPRPVRDRAGELKAVVVLVEPLSVIAPLFDLPQLGPGHSVTLLDGDQTLLAQVPAPVAINIGQQLADFSLKPGPVAGSVWFKSPLDGRERLTVHRELPFSLTSGQMTLLVGMDKPDYLDEWWHSTQINIALSVLIVLCWIWVVVVMRRASAYYGQLRESIAVTRKVLEEMPVPVALVDKSSGVISHSNAQMVDEFGALAGVGQPVQRLFVNDSAWGDLHSLSSTPPVVEMVARKGRLHVELHRTDLGRLDKQEENYWLVVLIDVSERFLREQRLHHDAYTDTLTGLANRRFFTEAAAAEIKRTQREQHTLAVLGLDLDHFKRVNDQYGHDVGDLVLQSAARVFQSALRTGDFAARMGGEEFSAFLPNADIAQATAVANRVRQAIASTPILLPPGEVLTVTVSIGISLWQEGEEDLQPALKRADQALYQAKQNGRNRVEAFAMGMTEASDE